jgi:hypothetical protein
MNSPAFDIRLAGLSGKTVKQIGADLEAYQVLLKRSHCLMMHSR